MIDLVWAALALLFVLALLGAARIARVAVYRRDTSTALTATLCAMCCLYLAAHTFAAAIAPLKEIAP